MASSGVTRLQAVMMLLLVVSLSLSGTSLMLSTRVSSELSKMSESLSELRKPVVKEIRVVNAWTTFLGKPDPYLDTGAVSSLLMGNLYDALVDYDESTPPKIEPALAESWKVSDDKLVYTFNLRKGVKFHSGNEFTAEDVKYSIDRLLTINMGHAFLFAGILKPGDTDVVDKYAVRFRTRIPFAPFIQILAYLQILDSKLMKEHTKAQGPYGPLGDYGSDWLMGGFDAGCGPYRLTEFRAAETVILDRFDDYYRGWKENQITKIEILLIKEEATYKLLMDTGVITISDISRSPTFYKLMRESPMHRVLMEPGLAPWGIWFNVKKPPLDDVHLRRALAYAMDSEKWIKDVLLRTPGVTSDVINGPLARAMPMSIDDQLLGYSTHNIAAAKKELAQSKYKGEVITFNYVPHEDFRLTALLFQSGAAEIGVNIKIEALPWAQYIDAVARWETTPHIEISYSIPAYLDPDAYLYPMFHTLEEGYASYNRNPMHYSNPKVDELLEKGRSSQDPAERARIYAEVQRIIHSEVPCVFGVTRGSFIAAGKHFTVNLNGAAFRNFDFWRWKYVP